VTSSPPSSSLNTPPSDPIDSPSLPKRAKKGPTIVDADDEPLTPPPASPKKAARVVEAPVMDEAMDVDEEGSPLVSVSHPSPS
jgi:hypothetical protein